VGLFRFAGEKRWPKTDAAAKTPFLKPVCNLYNRCDIFISSPNLQHERICVNNGEDEPTETSGTTPTDITASTTPEVIPDTRRIGSGSGNQPASRPTDEAASKENVSERLIALDFEVHKSIRYHAKRRSFFDKCNNLTRAASAIFAAGAVVSVVGGSSRVTIIVSVSLAVLSSIDLVIDFSRRARSYDDLCRDYCELAATIEERPGTPDEALVRMWGAKKLRLEAREPTNLDVLNVICANEELEGRGYPTKYRIRWWQRPFSHLFSLPPYDFPEIKSRMGEITRS
jgi:hypothetical protein